MPKETTVLFEPLGEVPEVFQATMTMTTLADFVAAVIVAFVVTVVGTDKFVAVIVLAVVVLAVVVLAVVVLAVVVLPRLCCSHCLPGLTSVATTPVTVVLVAMGARGGHFLFLDQYESILVAWM